MHTTNLRKIGHSVMIDIPPAILERLHLQDGATVGLAIEGDRLIVDPLMKPRYTLDELLAQCDPNAPIADEDYAWIDLRPVGKEL